MQDALENEIIVEKIRIHGTVCAVLVLRPCEKKLQVHCESMDASYLSNVEDTILNNDFISTNRQKRCRVIVVEPV